MIRVEKMVFINNLSTTRCFIPTKIKQIIDDEKLKIKKNFQKIKDFSSELNHIL